MSGLESGREKQKLSISNTEKISEISYPFVILIERLRSGKYLKVEMRMILMILILINNLIKMTLNCMTLMQHKFLDLRYH